MNNAPNEEKLFTKGELETIVEQRLSRERRNGEAFSKIKELMALLRQKEAFKKISNASLAQMIEDFVQSEAEPPEVFEPEQQAIPDALIVKEDDNGEITQEMTAETAYGQQEENTLSQSKIPAFLLKYGEDKFLQIMRDPAFRAFCEGKSGDILSLYESYSEFLKALCQSPEAKRHREAQRMLASTGFSNRASAAVDYGSLLTENQKMIAKAAGMSYRQYSELISQIPTKKL